MVKNRLSAAFLHPWPYSSVVSRRRLTRISVAAEGCGRIVMICEKPVAMMRGAVKKEE